jgi:hypothetical protein
MGLDTTYSSLFALSPISSTVLLIGVRFNPMAHKSRLTNEEGGIDRFADSNRKETALLIHALPDRFL